MSDIARFSAYWFVKNNSKPSGYKNNHIKQVKTKNLDYFICSQNLDEQTKIAGNKIHLEIKDLPCLPYLNNLTNFCKSRDTVYLKFGLEIQSSAFLKLAKIWTSKILFFQKILDYTDKDYLMWIDCVYNTNLGLITSCKKSSRCCINQYGESIEGKNFGGLLKNTLPPTKILAQVIKLPRHIIKEFIEKYIECLKFTDDNFIIYDEEIVLTIMYEKYPQLFNLHK